MEEYNTKGEVTARLSLPYDAPKPTAARKELRPSELALAEQAKQR